MPTIGFEEAWLCIKEKHSEAEAAHSRNGGLTLCVLNF